MFILDIFFRKSPKNVFELQNISILFYLYPFGHYEWKFFLCVLESLDAEKKCFLGKGDEKQTNKKNVYFV